jgi:hypothetical protein
MKKIVSFILTTFLGFTYVWGIVILDGLSGQFLAQHNILLSDGLIFNSPIILSILTVGYLIWKKKGYTPIIGLILGFIVGYFLMLLGMGLGNV